MSIENLDDASTIEDVIAHFGTKGMKWGVRKNSASGRQAARTIDATRKSLNKKVKPTSDQIKIARASVKAQNADIKAQAMRVNVAKGRQKAEESAVLKTKIDTLSKDPDSKTARRLTKGEKAITAAVLATEVAVMIGVSRRGSKSRGYTAFKIDGETTLLKN